MLFIQSSRLIGSESGDKLRPETKRLVCCSVGLASVKIKNGWKVKSGISLTISCIKLSGWSLYSVWAWRLWGVWGVWGAVWFIQHVRQPVMLHMGQRSFTSRMFSCHQCRLKTFTQSFVVALTRPPALLDLLHTSVWFRQRVKQWSEQTVRRSNCLLPPQQNNNNVFSAAFTQTADVSCKPLLSHGNLPTPLC